MRKITVLFLSIILTGIFIFIAFNKAHLEKTELSRKFQPTQKHDRIGEKITYRVRLGRLNLGKAVFKQLPNAELRGRKVNLITFETRLARFTDLERIYSDPESFLPLRVERYVSTWPFPERIIEDYDQEKFVLVIKKFKRNRQEEMVIKKGSVINNAILLPYYVRDIAKLEVGYNLIAALPAQEFIIELVAIEEIDVPAGKFMAYRFESRPKKFEVWISADERRIPVKINGTIGLGYSLVMQAYSTD